mmetsp:Transcript_16665/g.47050  ORF Transcript_16665/g.47050 Transcript_16665/m.47050 type:complete len:369 (+) Transcript_16665:164-1270(+)
MAESTGPKLFTRDEFAARFDDVSKLVHEYMATNASFKSIPAQVIPWVSELLDYTLKGGKLVRGVMVVRTYQEIIWAKEKRDLTDKELYEGVIVGWCVEALQAFFLVEDDIMDQSITRRGQPCWYLRKHPQSKDENDKIGLSAVNDGMIVQSTIHAMVYTLFKDRPDLRLEVMDVFNEVTLQTEIGQFLDMTSQPTSTLVETDKLTMDVYIPIVHYKTSFYSFVLPVFLGLVLTRTNSEEAMAEARDILISMGEFFQIQDDYLDCYADPKVLGKIGRDVEEKKCGWLAVKAMEKATPEQKQLFADHYGKDNAEDVKIIKDLYRELDLEGEFRKYEEKTHKELVEKIDKATIVPKSVYKYMLGLIYKRKN